MKKKKNHIVLIKKSNDLIQARYKFDIWEMRLFLSILANIRKDDDDFTPYRIWYKDVIKAFNLKSAEAYNYLREAANSLLDKKIHTHYIDKGVKRDVIYNIFGKIDVLSKEAHSMLSNFDNHGYIDITVHPDMKPFLLQLQKNFTAYDLRNITKLGVYPVRIYELLKQYEIIGNRKLDVDEIKEMLELKTEYPLFGNFYQRIIEPAINEINEYTDIYISTVEKIKEGKKIVALHFFFRKKTIQEIEKARKKAGTYEHPNLFSYHNESINFEQTQEVQEEIEPVNEEKDGKYLEYYNIVVEKFGVSPTIFFQEIGKYDKDIIDKAIRITNEKLKTGKIKNISGFFVQSLRDNYNDISEKQYQKNLLKAQEKEKNTQLKKELEEQLITLDQFIKQQENETVRLIVKNDDTATLKAIEEAKIIIQRNPRYAKKMALMAYEIEKIDIEVWRQNDFLKERVIEGFKKISPADFQHLGDIINKRKKISDKIKELS